MKMSERPANDGMWFELGVRDGAFGKGKASLSLVVEERHLNKGGVLHGGIYAMMLDKALGSALISVLPENEWCATTMLNTSFISPAFECGVVEAHGRLIKRGRNVAHLEGEVLGEGGKLLAKASGTWAIWQSKPDSMSNT